MTDEAGGATDDVRARARGATVAPGVPYTVQDLSASAAAPYGHPGTRLTVAGRALAKHNPINPGRGLVYPPPTGNAAAISRQAQRIVDEVLGNPDTNVYLYRGTYIHAWPPGADRRLIRWNLDGTFNTFLEKPQ